MRLEILIGMIASGKSTYARQRAREGALIICHDDLTAMLHGEYRYEPGLRVCYRQMEEWLVRVALAHSRDAVIDRTHLTTESRARWVTFARTIEGPTQIVAVTFPIHAPILHAERRHDADPRGRSFDDWLRVASHHAEQAAAEPLDWQAEGFDRHEAQPPQPG